MEHEFKGCGKSLLLTPLQEQPPVCLLSQHQIPRFHSRMTILKPLCNIYKDKTEMEVGFKEHQKAQQINVKIDKSNKLPKKMNLDPQEVPEFTICSLSRTETCYYIIYIR